MSDETKKEGQTTNDQKAPKQEVKFPSEIGTKADTELGLDPNVAAALSYIWIVGLIFFLIEKKNKFVRFHALQAVIGEIVLGVAVGFLAFIPCVTLFAGAGVFIFWVYVAVQAYQGKWFKLPVLGDFVAEQVLK